MDVSFRWGNLRSMLWWMSTKVDGAGLVVSVEAFKSDDPSSIPALYN